ncbi:hypothetical protein C1646_816612 [Rhizophagus diaphanus]|nr:hypothetical protein C1646_816612 [Rhizophagus diaphanus] [Rhizophagus sp. MUCL 43196]
MENVTVSRNLVGSINNFKNILIGNYREENLCDGINMLFNKFSVENLNVFIYTYFHKNEERSSVKEYFDIIELIKQTTGIEAIIEKVISTVGKSIGFLDIDEQNPLLSGVFDESILSNKVSAQSYSSKERGVLKYVDAVGNVENNDHLFELFFTEVSQGPFHQNAEQHIDDDNCKLTKLGKDTLDRNNG